MLTKAKELRVYDFLKKLELSDVQSKNLNRNPHLESLLSNCSNLSQFNSERFKALLNEEPVEIPWTSTDQYIERIMKRNDKRNWGLTMYNVKCFMLYLKKHRSSLNPTGVNIWLGKGLVYNWTEAMFWLKDELEALNHDFKISFDTSRIKFRSNFKRRSDCGLFAVKLDVGTYWNPVNGIAPWDILRSSSIKVWPDLSIPFTLALNPQVFTKMDGKTIPYMWAPGLVIDSNNLPVFYRDEPKSTAHVIYDYRLDDSVLTSSMVTYA